MQLTVRQVAELLGVTEKTVYGWVDTRGLPGVRLGGQLRFNRAELLEWATTHRVEVSPKIFQEEAGSAGFDLVEILGAGGIHYGLEGDDKESALRAVVDRLRLPDGVDREFVYEMLLMREALGSTGIGEGIAIPHARDPIVLHVERPTLTLCFLARPIEFDALDGNPVHALFTVVSPTVKAHLHLLARVAHALRDKGFRSLIIGQAGADEILAGLGRSPGIGAGAKG
jgi:nitrogen PTS system EIIA component